jgi:hypothetical protein
MPVALAVVVAAAAVAEKRPLQYLHPLKKATSGSLPRPKRPIRANAKASLILMASLMTWTTMTSGRSGVARAAVDARRRRRVAVQALETTRVVVEEGRASGGLVVRTA